MPHIHEKIDYTAEALIVYQDKVLLRIHDKYNLWLGVGGHIELDEDPLEAVIREAKEEVGLDITVVGVTRDDFNDSKYRECIPPEFFNRHRINDTHEHVTMTWICTSESAQIVEPEREKSNGIKWFSYEELDDLQYGIDSRTIWYAKRALDKVRNSVSQPR